MQSRWKQSGRAAQDMSVIQCGVLLRSDSRHTMPHPCLQSAPPDVNLDVPLPACAACGKADPGVKLKKCGQCGKVSYCSVDCQRQHWKVGATSRPAPQHRPAR